MLSAAADDVTAIASLKPAQVVDGHVTGDAADVVLIPCQRQKLSTETFKTGLVTQKKCIRSVAAQTTRLF